MSLLCRRLLLCLAFLCPFSLCLASASRGEERTVDLNLVLAIDSSSSVTMDEYYLQLEGYARAFAHPELWAAIRSLPRGAINVALFEWSGPRQQTLNFEWRVLDSEAAVQLFAAELALAPRFVIGGETAIGDALLFALALLDQAPTPAAREVVDVSGDGPSNRGVAVAVARHALLDRGIVINGLAVVNDIPELGRYYEDSVIAGVGSFVLTARDYADFQDVILRKLVREIRLLSQLRPHGD